VVLDGPLGVTGGVLDALVPEGGIAHAQDAKLGGHAIEIEADAVEIRVGGAMGEGRRDCVLCRRRVRYRLTAWIEQNAVDIGKLPKHLQESTKLGCGCAAHRAGEQLELDTAVWSAIQDARDELPGTWGREGVGVPVEDAEQLWPEADEGNHLRPNACVDGPL